MSIPPATALRRRLRSLPALLASPPQNIPFLFFPTSLLRSGLLRADCSIRLSATSTVLAERLPNGGLLMTATTETFDVDNPAHMAAAKDMAKAMAPLDRLPWPSGR